MWPIGRKRVIEMQSCSVGFDRSIAHFCSDMTTLGFDFPLKQGNLGNVISSVGLQAKRRIFLSGTVLPCIVPVGSVPWACSLPLVCKGTPSLWAAERLSTAEPQGAASAWEIQSWLLRISWSLSSEYLQRFQAKMTCEGPVRASMACKRELMVWIGSWLVSPHQTKGPCQLAKLAVSP